MNLYKNYDIIIFMLKETRMKNKYNNTITACFIGYIVQAIVNNFTPLLFLFFNKSYYIQISHLILLITFNF